MHNILFNNTILSQVIDIKIHHKDNSPLICEIMSLDTLDLINLKEITLQIIDGFQVKLLYISHKNLLHEWHYYYEAYNPLLLEQYIQNEVVKNNILGDNILNNARGFLFIDPLSHNVDINSIFTGILLWDLKDIDSYILSKQQHINGKKYNIICKMDISHYYPNQELECLIPHELYDYLECVEKYALKILKIGEEGCYISLFLPVKIIEQFTIVLTHPESRGEKEMYFAVNDITHSKKNMIESMIHATETAYSYINYNQYLEITIHHVPPNLSLKGHLYYNGQYYKIIEFSIHINHLVYKCIIKMKSYGNLPTPLDYSNVLHPQKYEKITKCHWKDIFFMDNGKLFIQKQLTQYLYYNNKN